MVLVEFRSCLRRTETNLSLIYKAVEVDHNIRRGKRQNKYFVPNIMGESTRQTSVYFSGAGQTSTQSHTLVAQAITLQETPCNNRNKRAGRGQRLFKLRYAGWEGGRGDGHRTYQCFCLLRVNSLARIVTFVMNEDTLREPSTAYEPTTGGDGIGNMPAQAFHSR